MTPEDKIKRLEEITRLMIELGQKDPIPYDELLKLSEEGEKLAKELEEETKNMENQLISK